MDDYLLYYTDGDGGDELIPQEQLDELPEGYMGDFEND